MALTVEAVEQGAAADRRSRCSPRPLTATFDGTDRREERGRMNHLSRRELLGGTTAAAVTLFAPSVHAQKGRRTLRLVPHADLKILDPVWTNAYITRNHSYLVYDTLFGTDEQLQVKPQMVDRTTLSQDGMKYVFTLRDGLKWH